MLTKQRQRQFLNGAKDWAERSRAANDRSRGIELLTRRGRAASDPVPWLRGELKKIRESKPGSALSRIEIANMAMMMLERREKKRKQLLCLLRELLDLDRHREARNKQVARMQYCAVLDAIATRLGVRRSDSELARRVGVERTTVLKWRRRSTAYQKELESARKIVSHPQGLVTITAPYFLGEPRCRASPKKSLQPTTPDWT